MKVVARRRRRGLRPRDRHRGRPHDRRRRAARLRRHRHRPLPGRLLAASLASCTAVTMEMYAERKGWEIGAVEVDVDATYDGHVPTAFDVTVRLPAGLSEEQRERLLRHRLEMPGAQGADRRDDGDDLRPGRGALMDLGLAGRTCAVTGASRGIGLETAKQLCAEGANVLLIARNEERLAEATEEVAAAGAEAGGRAAHLAIDVTSRRGRRPRARRRRAGLRRPRRARQQRRRRRAGTTSTRSPTRSGGPPTSST